MKELESSESKLIGDWNVDLNSNKVTADSICERIRWLTDNVLKLVSMGDWEGLYVDPNDGRYWELTYPKSHMHGGGPPSLCLISESDARNKYVI